MEQLLPSPDHASKSAQPGRRCSADRALLHARSRQMATRTPGDGSRQRRRPGNRGYGISYCIPQHELANVAAVERESPGSTRLSERMCVCDVGHIWRSSCACSQAWEFSARGSILGLGRRSEEFRCDHGWNSIYHANACGQRKLTLFVTKMLTCHISLEQPRIVSPWWIKSLTPIEEVANCVQSAAQLLPLRIKS